MNIQKLNKIIKDNKRFLICTHINPDLDGLASELALAKSLKKIGKSVYVVSGDKTPRQLSFLPGIKLIRDVKKSTALKYDVAIILDCGDIMRIGKVKALLRDGAPIVNVDHHITNTKFGTVNYVDPSASSTSEMLYDILVQCKFPVNKDIAVLLYLGIMTDTGSFRYDCTTSRTHYIVAELMKYKFSPNRLYQRLYETHSINDIRAFGKLAGNFISLKEGKILSLEISKDAMSQFSDGFDLRNKLFNQLRSIGDAKVIAIFSEEPGGKTKINFRSTGSVDVARLAASFGGGGHPQASGCMIASGVKSAQKKVLAQLKKIV